MDWFLHILGNPAGPAFLAVAFALVIWLGVKLGRVKIGGVALGVTFVLFIGILVGHLYNRFFVSQHAADPDFVASMQTQQQIINFIKELGLILFVYCIGLQVGPGFFSTLKKGGIRMNVISAGIVLLNVAVMLVLFFLWFYDGKLTTSENSYNLAMMVGVMYGAVTNTPGLGAASNVLPSLSDHFGDVLPALGNGYACAYPLGVIGIIGATILVRYLCRISLQQESDQIERDQEADPAAIPHHIYIQVTNRGIFGHTLKELHGFLKRDFVCSRCKINEEMFIPNGDTVLQEGMKLLLVCAETDMESVVTLIGERINESWRREINESTKYVSRRLVVTNPDVNGKTFNDLHISTLFNVNVTRVSRNGMTMFASRGFRLQMGDRLLMTGTEENVARVSKLLGNEIKHLEHPNVGMVFLGIFIGVLVGQIPIPIPGVELPVRLGLAGGPLVVAILIGAFGYKFNITAYTTTSANLMVREIGLALFLAGVGIQAGATFWDTVVNGGYHYVWMGFLITVIPILLMGVFARWQLKLNYYTLMGLIAGTYTDPPALAFANQTAGNDAPAIGYTTVYPLSMFLRILVAQLVLLLIVPLL